MSEEMRIQIIMAGIGGQGILFSSKIFSNLGLKLGLNVLGSETHGMSQRGGSVITHLKLGDFQSPLIRSGCADILFSLDKNETYRALKFLKQGGLCFVNSFSPDRFEREAAGFFKKRGITCLTCDAGGTALKIGSSKAANVVLIGFSVGTGLTPFKHDDVRNVLELVSKEDNRALNLRAFDTGCSIGKEILAGK